MLVRALAAMLGAALLVPATATSPAIAHLGGDGQAGVASPATQDATSRMTPDQIIAELRRPENSTGNVADGVEAATGTRGWMSADMKPILDKKIVGRAWTAVLRPVLKTDDRAYPNYALQILDEAET